MKRYLLAVIVTLFGCVAWAQVPPGGYGPGQGTGSGGGTSLTSFTTLIAKYIGRAPNDYGAFGDFKACYDINVSGQPTSVITSSSTFTLAQSGVANNIVTYTFTNTNGAGNGPVIAPGQTFSVTGSNNANGALNVTNLVVASASQTVVTAALTHANETAAADTGTITTAGAGNVGCMNFNASRDVGKVLESKGIGAAGALLSTTIASVQSPTQATLTATATTNATLRKAWSCHDDTTALQSWVTDINNGFPVDSPLSGGTILIHAGYVPGLYCSTQPLRFVNPLGNLGYCGNCGFGTPEPFSTLANAGESLFLSGNSAYRSGFIALSTTNFQLPSTIANVGFLYHENWNGPTITNLSIMAPDNSVVFTFPGQTGRVAGYYSQNSAHEYSSGLQIANWNGGNGGGVQMVGHIQNACYECYFGNSQVYGNLQNGLYGTGIGTGTSNGSTEGSTFFNIKWEGWLATACVTCASVEWAGSGNHDDVIENSRIEPAGSLDGPGGTASAFELQFDATVTGATNIILSNTIIQSTSSNYSLVQLSPSGAFDLTLNGVILNASANAGASTVLIHSNGTGATTITQNGGALLCNATCILGITNSASSTYWGSNVRNGTGVSNGAFSFPGGGVNSFFNAAGGWNGSGSIAATQLISNQGAICTNGELVLSAGWQATGAATVTAVSGTGQTCSWTITTGTTTTANPTVTDTLTNALPAATTACEMNIHGGTGTTTFASDGPFLQTTLSATAPIFTFQGTPLAGGSTYFVTRRCGP